MRAFVALDLSREAREAAAGVLRALRRIEAAAAIEASWSRPEGLHLTLYFLGSIEPGQLPGIEASLTPIAAAQKCFSLGLAGAGTFPKGNNPQVLWLGIRGALSELAALRTATAHALGRLGFPPQPEDFTPHVTLLRLKRPHGGRVLATALKELPLPVVSDWQARELVLFESRSSAAGSVYTPLARFGFSEA